MYIYRIENLKYLRWNCHRHRVYNTRMNLRNSILYVLDNNTIEWMDYVIFQLFILYCILFVLSYRIYAKIAFFFHGILKIFPVYSRTYFFYEFLYTDLCIWPKKYFQYVRWSCYFLFIIYAEEYSRQLGFYYKFL